MEAVVWERFAGTGLAPYAGSQGYQEMIEGK